MAQPLLVGDTCGIFTLPVTPPQQGSFTVQSGSTKVFIEGKNVALAPPTTLLVGVGAVSTASLLTTKVFIEGQPVIVGGAVLTLTSGWVGGVAQSSAVKTQVT